jgi:DNA polymerase-3 subunit delta
MKQLTISSFLSYLKKPDQGHQFVIYGEEAYFFDYLLKQMLDEIFSHPGDKELNYHLFYGSETNVSNILSACLSYPMMATGKLVVVKEFEQLTIQDKESFLKYLERPQPTTTLVLMASRWGMTRFHQQILENCISVRCNRLKESELYSWTGKRFKNNGVDISEEAVAFLIENIGQNLQRLDLEIIKVINYIKPKTIVDLSEISQITGFSREVNVFSLQKELAAKRLKSGLSLGMRLLEQGESLAALLPLLFIFFRRMLLVKELVLKKYNRKQILEKVAGNAYLYNDIFTNVNNFTSDEIMAVIESIETAELDYKTTQKPDLSILTMLCYKICSKKV